LFECRENESIDERRVDGVLVVGIRFRWTECSSNFGLEQNGRVNDEHLNRVRPSIATLGEIEHAQHASTKIAVGHVGVRVSILGLEKSPNPSDHIATGRRVARIHEGRVTIVLAHASDECRASVGERHGALVVGARRRLVHVERRRVNRRVCRCTSTTDDALV